MQKNIANFLTLLGCLGLGFTLTKTSYASIIVFNFAEIKNIQKSDYDSTLRKTLFAESRQLTWPHKSKTVNNYTRIIYMEYFF